MKKFKDIRWIHLSDLHIGCQKNRWMDDTLRRELLYYLKNDMGRIDFILITGDIIHQGGYDNQTLCMQAEDFIKMLRSEYPKIIYCAGNHDYIRNKIRFKMLEDWQALPTEYKEKEEEEYAIKLSAEFKSYIDLCNRNSEDAVFRERTFVYKNIEGLNVVVLNTSIFSGQPVKDENNLLNLDNVELKNIKVNDSGRLWICEKDLPTIDQLSQEHPTIVIGHHPITMFDELSQKRLNEFITKVNGKYICGHVHKVTETKNEYFNQDSGAGLFKDEYNIPSFTYNIIDKSNNGKIEKQEYSYIKNRWQKSNEKDKLEVNDYKKARIFRTLYNAIPEIAEDLLKSDILYFFGLQASSFRLDSPYIGKSLKNNRELDIKLLLSNPYNDSNINRLQEIPDYDDIMSDEFRKKWNHTKNVILNKSNNSLPNMKIKYHNFPLWFREIITSNYLYIGLYEDKDSSESKIYRFDAETEIYKAMKMHFETTWPSVMVNIPDVVPAKYRIFDLKSDFFVTPSLVINVTDKCNMNCVYCPDGGENLCKGTQPCSLNSIKLLIQSFKNNIKNKEDAVLRITGGEPFLEDVAGKTIEILKEAKRNNYSKVVLCTNGYYLGEIFRNQHYKNVMQSVKDILLLKISLDSLEDNNFFAITQFKGVDIVKNNIIHISRLNFKIELNVVVTKYNVHEIMNIYAFAAKYNLVGIKVLTVNDFGNRVKLEKVVDESTDTDLKKIVNLLQNSKEFFNRSNVFLNDNKGVAMKKYEDKKGCVITIVDHNNTANSITPHRVFCKDCDSCDFYPLSDKIVKENVKPCATGIMSLTMRYDGMISFCRLKESKINISNGKNFNEMDNLVRKELKHFNSCFIS